MLLKTADDKSKRIALLQNLQHSSLLDQRQKNWLREELIRLRKGIEGERDSAYFLDHYFKGGENHVLLHDLRVVFNSDVAQIDHLIINRGVGVYLIETKNYAGNVSINDHGEFTVEYGSDRFGVPSPIEQSKRHARILQRLMERLEIKNRTGGLLNCYHVVMFHPRAIIKRPKTSVFDSSNVIKADQFPSWHQQFVDKEFGVTKLLQAAANLRALDTVKEWGEKLIRQHRPADPLSLPGFIQARVSAPPFTPVSPILGTDWGRKPSATPEQASTIAAAPGEKRLVCLRCKAKISYAEGKFCWNNAVRFEGGQYCREHQALF